MLTSNLVVAANINTWMTHIGVWGIGAVALGVGIGLVGSGIAIIGVNLFGTNQSWGKAISGLVVLLIGGVFTVWGGKSIWDFAKTYGQDIPHS